MDGWDLAGEMNGPDLQSRSTAEISQLRSKGSYLIWKWMVEISQLLDRTAQNKGAMIGGAAAFPRHAAAIQRPAAIAAAADRTRLSPRTVRLWEAAARRRVSRFVRAAGPIRDYSELLSHLRPTSHLSYPPEFGYLFSPYWTVLDDVARRFYACWWVSRVRGILVISLVHADRWESEGPVGAG